MGKPNNFEQFKGPGMDYAPKPPDRNRQPSEHYVPQPDTTRSISEEDELRNNLIKERAGIKTK